jgi:hypothetical protein
MTVINERTRMQVRLEEEWQKRQWRIYYNAGCPERFVGCLPCEYLECCPHAG